MRAFRPRAMLLVALVLATRAQPLAAQSAFPPDSAIRTLLEARVREGRSAGIAIGMIEPDGGTRFIAVGEAGAGRMPLDRHTVFEIGSITKVFTGILLADMTRTGDVALDDPVSKYLPARVSMPAFNGDTITLEDLSTQTSGLPRLPLNLSPADPANPYADYTVDQLYDFLSGYTPTRAPGARYEYSNLGAGLLGHVLSRAADTTYEALVTRRILEPLGMMHTGITLTPWMREHVAAGHDASGEEVPLWDLPTLAGAGALRSTMNDMLAFIEANLRGTGPLHESMRTATRKRAETTLANTGIGLGWHRRAVDGDTIVWHNGGTGGFRTFAGFDPTTGTGVVVLTNSTGAGEDDVGFHLLNAGLPLAPAGREAIDLPAETLERYVGTYALAPQFSIEITRRGDALIAQATGQPRFRIWPASDTEFFLREVEATVTFVLGASGEVTGLVLHQGGRDTKGERVR